MIGLQFNNPNLKNYWQMKCLYYLKLCKDGRTPKHPLGNLSKDLKPNIWMYNTLGWGFTI